MAKSPEKFAVVESEEEALAQESGQSAPDGAASPAPTAGGPAGGPPLAQQTLQLDDASAIACYANFCRVTGTPEEVILDLGLNPQPFGIPREAVKVSQRLIMNYFTAKRLLAALSMTVQRHEQAFGVLETDVQKRIRPGPRS